MIRIIIFILITTLTVLSVQAQNSLKGNVFDAVSKETLIGASIYFPDLRKGATTDMNGFYQLDNLPTGTFIIQVNYIGYIPEAVMVHFEKDTIINFQLSVSIKEMEELIITGVSKSTERKLSPIPAVIASKEYLFQTQSTNIIDALARAPGVDQITTGPAISKPIIRGLGYNRVLTLFNGLRQEGQQWGDEHGIEIDAYSVDRIEIIKGPGSIAYGSDAMAGVINFLLPHEVEEGSITGSIEADYQTNNNLYGFSLENMGNIKGINWMARVSRKQSGNYKNSYDGKVYNSGFNEINFNGQVGVNRSWGFTHFYFSNFDQNLGIVEGERDTNGTFLKLIDANGQAVEVPVTDDDLKGYQIGFPKQHVNHFRVGTANQFYFNNSSLHFRAAYQRNTREEFTDPVEPDERELHFVLSTVNYDIKYFFPDMGHWETSLGINGMFQSNLNLGKEFLIPAYNMIDGGVFAMTMKKINKFFFSGGLRVDFRYINSQALIIDEGNGPETKFTAFKTDYENITGSVGGSYQPNDAWTIKLNLARGFRSPTIAELSSNGVHEGTFRYEIGNRDLKAETSSQIDAGVVFDGEHLTFETGLFYNNIDNYIFLQKLASTSGGDSIPDPSDPVPGFQYTQGDAHVYGGEVMVDLHPHPLHWLHFENSYALVYARQQNRPADQTNLPFIPAPNFKSELRADLDKLSKLMESTYLKLELEYFFAQNRIFSAFDTETATPSYWLLNFGFGTSVKNNKGTPLFSIFINANNLLNKGYQSHLSRLKYAPENPATGRQGVFNMGRNVSFKMVVPFDFM